MIKLKALLLTQLREKKDCLKGGRKRLLLTQLRKLVGKKDCLKGGRKRLRVKSQQNQRRKEALRLCIKPLPQKKTIKYCLRDWFTFRNSQLWPKRKGKENRRKKTIV